MERDSLSYGDVCMIESLFLGREVSYVRDWAGYAAGYCIPPDNVLFSSQRNREKRKWNGCGTI